MKCETRKLTCKPKRIWDHESIEPKNGRNLLFYSNTEFVKPYTAAQQIWKASNPQTIMSKDRVEKFTQFKEDKIMWILGLTHVLISIVFGCYFAFGNIWDEFYG